MFTRSRQSSVGLLRQGAIAVIVFLTMLANVYAANTILYFPSDFEPSSGAPTSVKNIANFAPICSGGGGSTFLLAGLDAARGFAQGSVCPTNSNAGSLASQPEYVFLVNDTVELSDYLKAQMQQKNALQSSGGRDVIKPTVVELAPSGDREGFKILIVGEVAYTSATNDAAWLAALDQRFAQDQVVAGGASGDDDIWIAYHGSYYNRDRQKLENVSLEKIVEYLQEKWQQMSEQIGEGVPAGSAGTPTPVASTTPPAMPMNAYMSMCNSQGVPLPPTWNPSTGPSQWSRVGALTNEFISSSLNAEVWKYDSTTPRGVCIALPRMKNGTNISTDIELLGIICQGEASGKACFWDNVERPSPDVESGQPETTAAEILVRRPAGGARIKGAATADLKAIEIRDGYNLEESCSLCHRGDNVYLIHPGTALSGLNTDTNASRYQPISGSPTSPLWRNLPIRLNNTVSPSEEDQLDGCTTCHEIPRLSDEYCGLLDKAIGETMPPSNPQGWRTSHCAEVRLLAAKCAPRGVTIKNLASNAANCAVTP